MRKTTKRVIELGDDDLKDAVVTWLLAKGERLSGNVYVTVDSGGVTVCDYESSNDKRPDNHNPVNIGNNPIPI